MKSQCFFILLCLGLVGTTQAQSEWRNWDAINVTVSPTRQLDFRLSHLRSYNITDSFHNNFNQSSAQLEYTFFKRLSVMGGAMLTQFPGGGSNTSRGYARVSYRLPLFKVLSFSNGIQAEVHSATEKRYQKRLIYITRLGLQKRLPFLRLAPSVSYWLYYNMGGQPIQYYDAAGVKLVKQTPDGFHRGRLFVNLNSKINRFVSVSVYYAKQTEFNLFNSPYRGINVKNPTTGKITRAFDSYNIIGASLAIDLNLYKNKK
jgi:hypothetical protein